MFYIKKQVLVIGLGRFGSSLAITLEKQGCEVLAIDEKIENTESVADYVTQAIQMDITDQKNFDLIGASNFDIAVVSAGIAQSASVIATLMCKEAGIPIVVAKANSELHAKILFKIGADKVVFPERDMGIKLGHSLASQSVLDLIQMTEEYSLIEIIAPKPWVGKSLTELDLRKEYGVNIVATKTEHGKFSIPMATCMINEGDVLVIIGDTNSLSKIEKL